MDQVICDLVFEGGGAKGVAFLGALKALEEANIKPGRLLGTSAGAMMATFIAAGIDSESLKHILTDRLPSGHRRMSVFSDYPTHFSDQELMDSRLAKWLKAVDLPFLPERIESRIDRNLIRGLLAVPTFKQIFSFFELGGLYEGDEIVRWMHEQLDSMDGLGQATLADMYEHTGTDLTMTAADITDRRLLILNHRTAPRLPVIWAVRMSISVPFYWQEVTWRSSWGSYRGREMADHAVVDGGVLANFPMELFLSADSYVTEVMGKPSEKVLGFLIDDDTDIPGIEFRPNFRTFAQMSLVLERLLNIIDTMLQAHDKLVLETYSDFVARLPARGVGTFEFDISDEKLDAIVEAAYMATKRRVNLWRRDYMGNVYHSITYDEAARTMVNRS